MRSVIFDYNGKQVKKHPFLLVYGGNVRVLPKIYKKITVKVTQVIFVSNNSCYYVEAI